MKKLMPYIFLIFLVAVMLTGCAEVTSTVPAMAQSNSSVAGETNPVEHLGPGLAESFTLSLAAVGNAYVSYPQPAAFADRITFKRNRGEPDEPEKAPIIQSDEIDPSKPMVALTFDDGPGEYTARFLDLFAQYNARATFCVIGEQVESGRDMIIRTFEEGHEIVGHSWSHRLYTRLSARDIEKDILDTNAVIESIIGVSPQMHRVPYGAINDRVKRVSEELGLSLLQWSVDPRDWESRDAELVFDVIMEYVKDGSIIVCHDSHESTAEAMELVIPELISRGYQLVTVSEMFAYRDVELEPGEIYRKAPPK